MRILVLNGSPKGKNSITYQTVAYWQIRHPEHSWDTLHVGQLIKLYEKDFAPAAAAIAQADLLLFSYPVYTFIAPSQLHRFVELMKAHRVNVRGKWATQLSTSKHFYDVTAHRYVMENAQDMGMRFVRGLSADMDDLTTEKGRHEADSFFDYLMWSVENGHCEPDLPAQPEPARIPVTVPAASNADKPGDIVILTDCAPEDTHLADMIARFRAVCPRKTRVINIRFALDTTQGRAEGTSGHWQAMARTSQNQGSDLIEYPIKGGCLGCFKCAKSGKCVYPDGFDEFLRNEIQKSEAEVHAFTISDHGMSSYFKRYTDRQFCNGHRTVRMGSPIGYIVSGNYRQEENLRMILEGRAEVGGNFLCGVATDEVNTDAAIDALASTMAYALEHRHVQPKNFLGVGGMRIFRDLIWQMQGLMREDHKFFKAHGQYDFPQKQRGRMLLMYLVGWMMGNEKLQKKAGGMMTQGMLMPYTKVLEQVKKEMQQ